MADRADVLTAPLLIEYPFSRTTGPVVGAFLTGLREQVIVGSKTSDGRVLVPPMEYDPETHEPTKEMVEVGPGGVVTTWAWVHRPHPKDPVDRPFAWALIRIDGADSALLHAVDAEDIGNMSTGMKVVPRWRDEREGHINDIECFVPEGDK
jgi:uncharacterized OB-fold protein